MHSDSQSPPLLQKFVRSDESNGEMENFHDSARLQHSFVPGKDNNVWPLFSHRQSIIDTIVYSNGDE